LGRFPSEIARDRIVRADSRQIEFGEFRPKLFLLFLIEGLVDGYELVIQDSEDERIDVEKLDLDEILAPVDGRTYARELIVDDHA
jgi:hypothetical protein